jgi:o-succinylbenzoate synthase
VKLTLESRSFRLPLRAGLDSAHGRRTVVEGVLLRVQDGQGGVGLGEVTPLPEFGTESLEAALRALGSVWLIRIPDSLSQVPEAFRMDRGAPATRAGVELAFLDLLARRRGVPLAQLLGAGVAGAVPVNALLRSEPPDALAREARAAAAAGFKTLKVKVGVSPASNDGSRLRAVRDAVGTAVKLRVDANGAWSESEARLRLAELVGVGLEYAEQPVAPHDIAGLRRLRALVPVAADEALGSPGAAEALLDGAEGPAADVLILKLPVLGGLLPALELARRAGARGVDAVVTSAMDGAVGRAGAAHLACALGGTRAHGLATGSLLVEDPGAHPVVDGALLLPNQRGLGIAPEALGW